jgi:predicted Zn-ribbon and HTH transcriptional regulator
MWFINFYECDECGYTWEDEWSCACNDTCPECGRREIEPYEYECVDDTPE